MIKLLILLILCSCGAPNKSTENQDNLSENNVLDLGGITFEVSDTVNTFLDNDTFVIPEIRQNDVVKYSIVLANKTTSNKAMIIAMEDPNFILENNCSMIRSRAKCSIILKNSIKNVGQYNSSFVINGKTVNFSLSIAPSLPISPVGLVLNSNSFNVETSNALILKNNSAAPISLSVDTISSEDNFQFNSRCPGSLGSRSSCSITISLASNAQHATQRTISINGQSISLTVQKNISPSLSDFSVSAIDSNISILDSGKIKFKITNSKTLSQSLNTALLSGGTTNCPSVLLSRKSCNYEHDLNTNQLKQGSQNITINVLGKMIQVATIISKTKCSGSSRVSSSECEQNSNNNFMSQNVINTSVYPNAICNDGSPASFFKRSGSGSGSNRWVIHLEEGGFCGEFPLSFGAFLTYFNVCPLRRQQTPVYVSTLLDPGSYRYNAGLLNGLESNNPDFYSWNHVEIRYCSSDIWSGNINRTISGEPYVWKFKGVNILDAVFDTLASEHDLNNAKNVIISGSSAGGFGVLAQGDYIKDTFLPEKDVVLLSDSSWVQDYNNLDGHNFFNLLFDRNIDYLNGRPDSSCSDRLGVTNHRCFLGAEAYTDLSTPSFIIQDQLDQFYLNIAYGISSVCSANSSQKSLMTGLSTQLRSQLQNKIGVVSPRSFSHVFLTSGRWTDKNMLNGELSIQEIFSNWYFNKTGLKSFISDPASLNQEISNFCN